METVRVFTAERMQEIEDGSVTGGAIVGDNLILTKHDGSTANAGNVRGPAGPVGSSPIVVTSTTRPTTGLYEGLVIYETDTKRTYIYTGSGWQSYEPLRICTSTTHPSSPFVGMEIYETDTHKRLIWNGHRFDPPWNMPWGSIWGAGITGSWGPGAETPLLLNGATSRTWTNVANRLMHLVLNLGVYRGSVNGANTFRIKIDGVTYNTSTPSDWYGAIGDDRFTFHTSVSLLALPAGTHTIQVTAVSQFTGPPFTCDPAGIAACYALLNDVGPWGNPV